MTGILLLVIAVQWTVIPDGPTTYAVVQDHGGSPHWSRRPDERGQEPGQIRICSQVPSAAAAAEIARLLNGN